MEKQYITQPYYVDHGYQSEHKEGNNLFYHIFILTGNI